MIVVDSQRDILELTASFWKGCIYLIRVRHGVALGGSETCYICVPSRLEASLFLSSFLTPTHRWIPFGKMSPSELWSRVNKFWPAVPVIDLLDERPRHQKYKRYKITLKRRNHEETLGN